MKWILVYVVLAQDPSGKLEGLHIEKPQDSFEECISDLVTLLTIDEIYLHEVYCKEVDKDYVIGDKRKDR